MSAMNAFWELAEPVLDTRVQAALTLLEEQERDSADPEYLVNRLVAGLASSRKSARQGFAAALTAMLLYGQTDVQSLFESARKTLSLSKGANRQERKENWFAWIFLSLALCKAQRLGEYPEIANQLIEKMAEVGEEKKWIKPLAFAAMAELAQFASESCSLVETIKKQELENLTPEELCVVISLGEQEFEIESIEQHLLKAVDYLYPCVHPVFLLILNKGTSDLKLLEEFVSGFIEEKLLESTPRRKAMAFKLAALIFECPDLSAQHRSSLALTDKLVDLSAFALSKKNHNLHACVRDFILKVIELAKANSVLASNVTARLTSTFDFDKKAKGSYVKQLVSKSMAESKEIIENIFDSESSHSYDQIFNLLKNDSVRGSREQVKKILVSLCKGAFQDESRLALERFQASISLLLNSDSFDLFHQVSSELDLDDSSELRAKALDSSNHIHSKSQFSDSQKNSLSSLLKLSSCLLIGPDAAQHEEFVQDLCELVSQDVDEESVGNLMRMLPDCLSLSGLTASFRSIGSEVVKSFSDTISIDMINSLLEELLEQFVVRRHESDMMDEDSSDGSEADQPSDVSDGAEDQNDSEEDEEKETGSGLEEDSAEYERRLVLFIKSKAESKKREKLASKEQVNFVLRCLDLVDAWIQKQVKESCLLELCLPIIRLLKKIPDTSENTNLIQKLQGLLNKTLKSSTKSDIPCAQSCVSQLTSFLLKCSDHDLQDRAFQSLCFGMKVLKSSEAGCDWIVENVIQVLVKELFLKKHSKITVRTLVSLTQRFPQVMWTAMPLFLLTIASIESDFLRFQMYILLEELSHFKSIDVEWNRSLDGLELVLEAMNQDIACDSHLLKKAVRIRTVSKCVKALVQLAISKKGLSLKSCSQVKTCLDALVSRLQEVSSDNKAVQTAISQLIKDMQLLAPQVSQLAQELAAAESKKRRVSVESPSSSVNKNKKTKIVKSRNASAP